MNANITAATVESSIMAPVDQAKRNLQIAATAAVDTANLVGEGLLAAAQEVMDAEALASAQITYLRVCQNNPARRMDYLFDLVAGGADDSWSGRKNDSRRSAHEGVRRWVQDQVLNLRYEG